MDGSSECERSLHINYEVCANIWNRACDAAMAKGTQWSLRTLQITVGSPVRNDTYSLHQKVHRERRRYIVEAESGSSIGISAGCSVVCSEAETYKQYPYLDAYQNDRSFEETAMTGFVRILPRRLHVNRALAHPIVIPPGFVPSM
jgi:hypothetical protein